RNRGENRIAALLSHPIEERVPIGFDPLDPHAAIARYFLKEVFDKAVDKRLLFIKVERVPMRIDPDTERRPLFAAAAKKRCDADKKREKADQKSHIGHRFRDMLKKKSKDENKNGNFA